MVSLMAQTRREVESSFSCSLTLLFILSFVHTDVNGVIMVACRKSNTACRSCRQWSMIWSMSSNQNHYSRTNQREWNSTWTNRQIGPRICLFRSQASSSVLRAATVTRSTYSIVWILNFHLTEQRLKNHGPWPQSLMTVYSLFLLVGQESHALGVFTFCCLLTSSPRNVARVVWIMFVTFQNA